MALGVAVCLGCFLFFLFQEKKSNAPIWRDTFGPTADRVFRCAQKVDQENSDPGLYIAVGVGVVPTAFSTKGNYC